MPIHYDEVYFSHDADKEAAFRSRVDFYLQKLQGLPTHAGWFDPELFEQQVIEMVLCEYELADWDRAISSDPFNKTKLSNARAATATRLNTLRKQLGIDSQRMKQLKPKKGEDAAPVELLPTFDELEV